MSGREWKPGDVALWTYPLSEHQMALRVIGCSGRNHPSTAHWHLSGGGWDNSCADEDVRPLVVIDPEDREQVERLASLVRKCGDPLRCTNHDLCLSARLFDALREFDNPKPEEPTNLAARVIDREGDTWARIGDRWVNSQGGKSQTWDFVVETFGPVEVQP